MIDVILGDCVQVMAAMPESSIDAIVTDPPYFLNFMNRGWDRDRGWDGKALDSDGLPGTRGHGRLPGQDAEIKKANSRAGQAFHEAWAREAARILKPGGHLLAFGGTRTYHRLACAIEDAGFEIRDSIADFGCLGYIYGSGFPKSLDVSKALDKAAGAEREVVGKNGNARPNSGRTGGIMGEARGDVFNTELTAPATDLAQKYDGWGTALKPAWEPIVVARKPLIGTVAANVERHGTGALNIDACRVAAVGGSPAAMRRQGKPSGRPGEYGDGHSMVSRVTPERYSEPREGEAMGRWPANVVLTHHAECEPLGTKRIVGTAPQGNKGGDSRVRYSEFGMTPGAVDYTDPDGTEEVEAWRCVPECAVRLLDEQSGVRTSGAWDGKRNAPKTAGIYGAFASGMQAERGATGDSGGASRFFYTAKASRSEREAWGRIAKSIEPMRRSDGRKTEHHVPNLRTTSRVNDHPTVKPIDLMAWLVRLVTPPDGLVLDPFCGSGTTLVAAQRERFNAIGIEMDPRSARIAKARADAMWEVKLL